MQIFGQRDKKQTSTGNDCLRLYKRVIFAIIWLFYN